MRSTNTALPALCVFGLPILSFVLFHLLVSTELRVFIQIISIRFETRFPEVVITLFYYFANYGLALISLFVALRYRHYSIANAPIGCAGLISTYTLHYPTLTSGLYLIGQLPASREFIDTLDPSVFEDYSIRRPGDSWSMAKDEVLFRQFVPETIEPSD